MKRLFVRTGIILICMSLLSFGAIVGCKAEPEKIVETVTETVVETVEVEVASEDEGTKMPEITFVTPLIAHPIWNPAGEGFMQAAKDFGFVGYYVGPLNLDATAEINLIENAIAGGTQGIITYVVSREAFTPTFLRLDELGIPYIFAGSDVGDLTPLARVGTDYYQFGFTGGKYLASLFDGEDVYADMLMTSMDSTAATDERDGFVAAFDDYEGHFELVLNEPGNSDIMIAIEKYQNGFAAHPEINCIMPAMAEGAPAAVQVVKEMQIEDRGIKILGVDATKQTLEFVKNGDIVGTLSQDFYTLGYESGRIMYEKIVNGVDLEGEYIDTGSNLITKENVDEWLAKAE
jgi:ABC-type sugar transport system substrate-binding protein